MKKITSILVTLAMLVSVLPTIVFAADNDSDSIVKIKVTATVADEEGNAVLVENENGEQEEQKVPVANATVNMYGPDGIYRNERTNNEGFAEFDLSEYTDDQISQLTFSACKTIASGSGIGDGSNGGNRDALFSQYGEDRLQLELHSEGIDSNGNWYGQKMPVGFTDQVDVAFVVDVSGSMQGTIDSVEENIQSFSEYLASKGLKLNISVIEYNSDQYDTHVYGMDKLTSELNNSPQISDVEQMKQIWSIMNATGGGSEIPIDGLGYLIGNETIHWRSSAHKFAFLMTDENGNDDSNNRWGYSSMHEIADKLKEEGVITSVVTEMSDSFDNTYGVLYNTTGGQRFDINTSDFAENMKEMADDIIDNANKDLELHLSEPRLLVDMSVCYYADDDNSNSDEYYNMVVDRMKDYSNYMAQATDAHVLMNNIYILKTDNRNNFYFTETDNYANVPKSAMADIRIITKIKDDGFLWNNATIRGNAQPAGFFKGTEYDISNDDESYEHFKNLDELLNGKKEFSRIIMSGHEGGGWSYTLEDPEYAETISHETGHYLMSFRDEYQDKDSKDWGFFNRPYKNYGLMDHQHKDIELSKDSIDYSYANGDFTSDKNATEHSFDRGMSCENTLAYLLEKGAYPWTRAAIQRDIDSGEYSEEWRNTMQTTLSENPDTDIFPVNLFQINPINNSNDKYYIHYSLTSDEDRTVEYSYSECNVVDWRNHNFQSESLSLSAANNTYDLGTATSQNLISVIPKISNGTIILNLGEENNDISIYQRMANGDSASTMNEIPIKNNQAEIALGNGQSTEITVLDNDTNGSNTYLVERSLNSDKGYYYQSSDMSVEGYVIPESKNEYLFTTMVVSYHNGNYSSVNKALNICSADSDTDARGELYSVASINSNIDYTTISWFKYDGMNWTKLDTDLSTEENMNIGARCDYAGEGTYVLMAKAASDEMLNAVTDIEYTNPVDRDGIVNLTFKDTNDDTAYYNIYYSDSKFTSIDDENVAMQKNYAGYDSYTVNFGERDMDGYVAVVAVASDGAKSPLSEVVAVNTGEADRDGDGVPDWYCDKYLLWPPSGEEKDIANSDDDGDGLTNLEEYKGGSDPTDPNDPVKTTNVAVDSISLSKSNVSIKVGNSTTVTAAINPFDATNQNVSWYTDDENIATVTGDGLNCTIKGIAEGSTKITAVTSDGGYTATATVTVSKSSSSSGGGSSSSRLSQVKADVPAGTVNKGTKVVLSNSNSSAIIYYTIDGSAPTTSSTKYSGTISIDEDMTIKAIAVKSGYTTSNVAIFKYTVDGEPIFTLKDNADNIKYMTVYDDGTFKPDQAATRYEILNALNNLFDFENISDSIVFFDVNSSNKDLVNKFACTGVINGYEDGTFRGNNGITRAELVKILSMMFDVENKNSTAINYPDVADHWAKLYIDSFSRSGYVEGYPDGTFKPDNEVTRAEFVKIVNNILGINEYSDTSYTSSNSSYNSAISDINDHWAQKDINAVTK